MFNDPHILSCINIFSESLCISVPWLSTDSFQNDQISFYFSNLFYNFNANFSANDRYEYLEHICMIFNPIENFKKVKDRQGGRYIRTTKVSLPHTQKSNQLVFFYYMKNCPSDSVTRLILDSGNRYSPPWACPRMGPPWKPSGSPKCAGGFCWRSSHMLTKKIVLVSCRGSCSSTGA